MTGRKLTARQQSMLEDIGAMMNAAAVTDMDVALLCARRLAEALNLHATDVPGYSDLWEEVRS